MEKTNFKVLVELKDHTLLMFVTALAYPVRVFVIDRC